MKERIEAIADLLPCPFCGGEAFSDKINAPHWKTGKETFWVECRSCVAMTVPEETEAAAIEKWNTRTATAEIKRLRGENAELREAKSRAGYKLYRQLSKTEYVVCTNDGVYIGNTETNTFDKLKHLPEGSSNDE